MSNKLSPIEEPYAEGVAAILKHYPQQNGYLLKLFRVFGNSLRFLGKGVPNLLDKESPLPLRERELVILRVTANLDCEYEWGVHVAAFADAAGFDERQVTATKQGKPDAACWSEKEQLLLKAVDELCENGGITPDTYTAVAGHWSREQQLEILALAGTYHTVSFVANTSGIDNEPFGATFPAS